MNWIRKRRNKRVSKQLREQLLRNDVQIVKLEGDIAGLTEVLAMLQAENKLLRFSNSGMQQRTIEQRATKRGELKALQLLTARMRKKLEEVNNV